MTRPTVAAVITSYRHGAFLRQAVDSVLGQTRPVDHCLVVDDASGPSDADYLADVERDVTVLRLPRNSGPGGARQAGAEAVDCDLIAYLDGDDCWVPTKLERQLEHFLAVPDASGSHTGTVIFDELGHERPMVDVKPLELDLRTQLIRNQISPSTMLIRKRALEDVGGWTAGRWVAEDWDLFIRMAVAGHRVIGLREPLTRFRRFGHQHYSQRTTTQVRRLVNTIELHAGLYRRILGPRGYRQVIRDQVMGHRYGLSMPGRAAAVCCAQLAWLGAPAATWQWLLPYRG